ncbi:MAG: membrane protein insertase YidC [Desulfobacteraceae bacterium]|nr:membrane protein insertase YidC [Desulfobacteraceae bacterium]MBU4055679.1 membrane protein insertase YidC [Pseudomonadota bacterium]
MEHVRMIAAIALTMLVLFVWQFFMADQKPKTPPSDPKIENQTLAGKPEAETVMKNPESLPQQMAVQKSQSRPERTLEIKTPLYTVKVSEKEASFKSYLLEKFKDKAEANAKPLEMIEASLPKGTIGLDFEGPNSPFLKASEFQCDQGDNLIEVFNRPVEMAFKTVTQNGLAIEKRYKFYPDSYLIDMSITVINQGSQEMTDDIVLSITQEKSKEESQYGFEGPSAYIDNKLQNIKVKKLEDQNVFQGKVDWIAFQDRYFISSILPKVTEEGSLRVLTETKSPFIDTQFIQPTGGIKSGTSKIFEYFIYMGPKSVSTLKPLGLKLDKAIDFGMFDIIAKPFLQLMNILHDYIPNYGVVIIILTILIKIVLWPLGSKSYKSMSEMKKIQPLMTEIREKYKDDKKKMNEEVMGLYRTYKINPLGGCLPMVVQIPVFFALYRMLYESIELRHAPFFGWINDLSAADRLFHFDFAIPFMQAPTGIPVLTIIMGASMFVQQKLSPPMGDPTQAKMMMFMPIIFTVIFINFSSGLVLYWLVNNVISILQQYYIQKKYA